MALLRLTPSRSLENAKQIATEIQICQEGLLCADKHKKELKKLGYNKRKAYCGSVGGKKDEVCYDPARLIRGPGQGQECSLDCDRDEDCDDSLGLVCADEHKQELIDAGFDPRKAYCGDVGRRTYEVCYDPAKLRPPCPCWTREEIDSFEVGPDATHGYCRYFWNTDVGTQVFADVKEYSVDATFNVQQQACRTDATNGQGDF
jgi:hypothetical protein